MHGLPMPLIRAVDGIVSAAHYALVCALMYLFVIGSCNAQCRRVCRSCLGCSRVVAAVKNEKNSKNEMTITNEKI